MRRFSLKEFLADPSQKVVTKEGHPVRIISTDFKGASVCFPVVGIEELDDGGEVLRTYTNAGTISSALVESKINLFFAPSKHTAYASLHRSSDGNLSCQEVGINEEVVARWGARRTDYVATAKIEWEE